ncbi:uracil-DNA glycosylase superfamily protein [Natrialba magadii ATCC 43099]|uniref:Uracil-DNA glycosylase superfamily protein n=2 Tax=Natrialba magadii (strain ATCC 43099 / DSM 3394 / CCM 3739 / CIP 104546 / IAM 13178 / JCM 8861 / NBRC 102185 / NCIMB 2190 / MS3) TaxID=547559 RepID=D3SSP7_NATMM|nr:uracil-DNA glycosylase superfamily protein [Natrialba magadii ATCC 43099]
MDANQQTWANPFSMDEKCRNCPALCETRTQVVHGYGDVGADFLFVGERPTEAADETGIPLVARPAAGDTDTETDLRRILERLALCDATSPADRPALENVYLTNLTRCRDPERPPTDEEIDTCEPYLNAEIRMINPEILIPIGERALAELGTEYTTTPADELTLPDAHATTIRGRGFELVPMIDPREQSEDQTQAWVEHFASLMASDYRQTKGRQER